MRVLITGGAGFVGGNLAVALAARAPTWDVIALDSLHRAGSELNLPRLRDAGVTFIQADVRDRDALRRLPAIDALVECSAEPSVLAGRDGDPSFAFETNLVGAFNCLELARRDGAFVVFLSTSRVYPVAALNAIELEDAPTRFRIAAQQTCPGVTPRGISERFPLHGARTLYGTTKLAAELLIAEYADAYGLRAAIDRCGVIAGPWQMGKVDQGVFTFWLAAHRFGRPLRYLGFGGSGKQVRDLLHVDDLVELITVQLRAPDAWAGTTFNVGGGVDVSLSLLETTALCREITGRQVPVTGADEDRPGDVPLYVSDCGALFEHTDWRPSRSATDVLVDIDAWLGEHEDALRGILLPA